MIRKSWALCLFLFLPFIGFSQTYFLYVASESEDEVAVIKFDGAQGSVDEIITVGYQATEIEGPHGLTLDPSGDFWYVTMAHGNPFGRVYKYATESNQLIDFTELGIFPASMQISPANGMLFCVNFNLHGKMAPSTISVVDPFSMKELKQIQTGAMPHGSRISPDGLSHFSVAMMSGELFEIDVMTMEINRKLNLDRSLASLHNGPSDAVVDHAAMGHAMNDETPDQDSHHSVIKPTWVIPHPDGQRVFVAANGKDMILEIDLLKWEVVQTFPTGKGPYNIEITGDGKKMIVSYKTEGTTAIWDLDQGRELAVIKNSRGITHGISVSPDHKYAFVSVEGKGNERGSVDIISLEKHELIDVVEVGKQAGGIVFWKVEE